jgi:hypothetical protein
MPYPVLLKRRPTRGETKRAHKRKKNTQGRSNAMDVEDLLARKILCHQDIVAYLK